MNLEQLIHIVELTKVKTLSEAATNLYISQPAISQSIANLEKELGIKLFHRTKSGTIPTDEGVAIIKKAHDVVKLIEEIRLEAASAKLTLSGSLQLATMPAQMITMVKVIAQLKKEHPNLHIQVYEQGSLDSLRAVKEGKIDLGMLAIREGVLHDDSIVFESLWQGKMMVFVGKQSPYAKRSSIKPEEMLQQEFVLYNDDYVHQFTDDFSKQYGDLNILFQSDYDTAIHSALAEGLAISVGHDFSLKTNAMQFNEQLVMLEIEDYVQPNVHFGWARLKNRAQSPICDYFVSRFKNEFLFGWKS